MREIITPGVDAEAFLLRGLRNGYSMQRPLVDPEIAAGVSRELEWGGYLRDLVELESTSSFEAKGMQRAHLLHKTLNDMLCEIEDEDTDHLPLFSVRVFEPGLHGTTVHRNHPSVGPWAIGITLKGEAPFNVYDQDQLPEDSVTPLEGDEFDPIPAATMNADAGAGWTLYTKHEFVPHSSGIVASKTQRELLLFSGMQ
ncbi:hypothetical protein BH09PAT3_BH09PAT3_4580 [soil metagenome]